LGIDPGSRCCGYGILQVEKKSITAAGCDIVKVDEKMPLSDRLKQIHENIDKIIKRYSPDVVAIETIFYGKNIKSAFTLGHARGVIMLAVVQNNLDVVEYSPREIKRSVVGNGNASKGQVMYMIDKLLGIKLEKNMEDAADALAIALCHYNRLSLGV
jgi:crossover junction endodeoxyribonuclease RuvC